MVLLSLGSQALIALMRTGERHDPARPATIWWLAAPEGMTALPQATDEPGPFSQFLQSSN